MPVSDESNCWLLNFPFANWCTFAAANGGTYELPKSAKKNALAMSSGDRVLFYVPKVGFVGLGLIQQQAVALEDGSGYQLVVSVEQKALIDPDSYQTNAPSFDILFTDTPASDTPSKDRAKWVYPSGRPYPAWAQQVVGEKVVQAALGQLDVRSLDPRVGDYSKKAASVSSADAKQTWVSAAGSVVRAGSSMPLTEVVRRVKARGYVAGTFTQLLATAQQVFPTEEEQALEGVFVNDAGHVFHLEGHVEVEVDDLLGSGNLQDAIDSHRIAVKRELLHRLLAMDPFDFEVYVGELLAAVGVEDSAVTARQNDGGIDITGVLRSVGVIRQPLKVQVKRWTSNVGRPTVQQMRGTLAAGELGLIVTTSDFTSEARVDAAGEAGRTPVFLICGADLAELALENEVGVARKNSVMFEFEREF